MGWYSKSLGCQSTGDGSNSTVWQGPHTYAAAGNYTVCLYETGVNPNNVTCIDTFCSTITVGGATACMATLNTTVVGPTATFNPTITGGTPPYTIFYNYGDGNSGTSNVHTYTAAGVYSPCVIVTDANNITCTSCDSFNITFFPPPAGCVATAASPRTSPSPSSRASQ